MLAWPLLAARARYWALAAGVAPRPPRRADPACGSACTSCPTWSAAGRSASAWALLTALLFGAFAGGRAALRAARNERRWTSGSCWRRDDGSLGPLLRLADDRLDAGAGYGGHEHREVDVVAVVLAGALRHGWGDGPALRAGDVAVLRAGSGLTHDEVAGDDGARVLQCLPPQRRAAAAPSYEVHRAPRGWVDLRPPDARLWVGRATAGGGRAVPAGLLVVRGADAVVVEQQDGGRCAPRGAAGVAAGRRPAGRARDSGRRCRILRVRKTGAMPTSAAELLSAAYSDADRTIDLRRRLHRQPEIGSAAAADPGDGRSRRSRTCRSR